MGSCDPNDTLIRQLNMLQAIPRYPKGVTVKQLQESLETLGFFVNRRTVQRDLNRLSRCFPLLDDGKRPMRWSWKPDAPALAMPQMESHCALLFWMMRQQLRPQLPKSTVQWLEPYFTSAAALLDNLSDDQAMSAWRDKIRVLHRGPMLQPAIANAAVEQAVYDALLHDRCLTLEYTTRWEGARKSYQAHPLGLVLKEGITYLVCTLWDYRDLRLLALHRIDTAEMMDKPATIPDGFSLDDYIASGELGFAEGEGRTIQLKVLFDAYTALHLEERPLSDDQTLEPYDETRYLLTATVQNSAELEWWLLGFGDCVTVLEPASLQQKILQTARAMVQQYEAAILSPDKGGRDGAA